MMEAMQLLMSCGFDAPYLELSLNLVYRVCNNKDDWSFDAPLLELSFAKN